jgi:hypothetical protein
MLIGTLVAIYEVVETAREDWVMFNAVDSALFLVDRASLPPGQSQDDFANTCDSCSIAMNLIDTAANVGGTNVLAAALALGYFGNFQMPVLFGSHGFQIQFQDPNNDDQVHHALAAVGYETAAAAMTLRYGTNTAAGSLVVREYWQAIGTFRLEDEDIAMNEAAIDIANSWAGGGTPTDISTIGQRSLCSSP